MKAVSITIVVLIGIYFLLLIFPIQKLHQDYQFKSNFIIRTMVLATPLIAGAFALYMFFFT